MSTRHQPFVSLAACFSPKGAPQSGPRPGRGRALLGVKGCIFLLALGAAAGAQTHRVTAPERVTRAVAVYEWTGELAKPTAARLVPVSLYIDGQFQNAGSFYARPVPLALLDGNIYSLEKAGTPVGIVTLDYARHLQTATAGAGEDTLDIGWFGYGTYAALPAAPKTVPLRASTTVPEIISSKDPDRPRLGTKTDAGVKPDTAGGAKPADKTGPAAPTAGAKPAQPAAPPPVADDPDRPHFGKSPSASAPATPATSGDEVDVSGTHDSGTKPTDTKTDAKTDSKTETKATDTRTPTEDDPDRPTLRHRDPKQAEADRKARERGSVSAIPGSLNNDPNRPTMRRGVVAGVGGAPAPQLKGLPAALHQTVAVSDAVTREPHPFAREWSTQNERADILAKMEALAQQQISDYERANGGAGAGTATSPKGRTKASGAGIGRATAVRSAAARPAALNVLTQEELSAYTLSYGGLPTFVYTAISPATAAEKTAGTGIAGAERYVTLVAQQVPSGELQVALASVTDAAHLDRTPWMRLVDVVDPDAGHRASLLFELRAHTSRQFGLYRILAAKADQIFVTNPTE